MEHEPVFKVTVNGGLPINMTWNEANNFMDQHLGTKDIVRFDANFWAIWESASDESSEDHEPSESRPNNQEA
jgi:hypothetical protein